MTSTDIINANNVSLSRMEFLQPNIMAKVLEFVELPDWLMAATASKALRRTVYKQCHSLWVHLDFSSLSKHKRSRLTDKELAGLLKRVNARNVTQTLSLASCDNVDGSGMSPLRHSEVLVSVDLRRSSPDINEERRATRELRTIVHHKLSHVRFNDPIGSYSSGVAHFFRVLHATKLKQALEQGLECIACGGAVADESRQLVPNVTGVPPNQCVDCHSHFCLGGDCPTKLAICVSCATAKCSDCDNITTALCDICAREYCKDCADVCFNKCAGCLQVSCGCCISKCATCDKTFCSHCIENEKSILSCFCCVKDYCFECRQVAMCFGCEQFLCDKCAKVKRCGYCNEYYCETCRAVTAMPNGSGRTVEICANCQTKMVELL